MKSLKEGSETKDEKVLDILLYGTSWCGLSRRTQRLLDQKEVAYRFIDIDKDPVGEKTVREINGGFRSVPTLVFPDGSTLTEPSTGELLDRLRAED